MTTEAIDQQIVNQAGLIARLRHDLDRLAHEATDTVADLLGRIEMLEAAASSAAGASSAWSWRDIGETASKELWEQLNEWVTYIRGRYPLARKIPDCWAEHPEVVEELTALWLAWQGAYADKDAPLTAPSDWHDRWLPGVLHRVEHGPFSLGCAAAHTARPASAYLATPPTEGDRASQGTTASSVHSNTAESTMCSDHRLP